MRRWIEAVAKLYPATWQQRYKTEFHALLEDIEPSWRQFFNVLGGALRMQLSMGKGIYLKLGAAFAALGMVIAAAASFVAPRLYISSAVIRVAPGSASRLEEVSDQPLFSAIQVVCSRVSLSEIIQRPKLDLYQRDRSLKPLEDVIEQMRHDLRISRVPSQDRSLGIRVAFLYADPQKARQVVGVILSRLVEESASQNLPAEWKRQNLEVVDPPTMPAQPVSPHRLVFVGVGCAIGILSGLIATYYIRNTRRAMLLTATGLAGCVLGAGFSLLIADRYISTAVVRVTPVGGQAAADAAGQLDRTAARLLTRPNLAELIQRPELNLYAKERSTTPLEDVIRKVKDHDLTLVTQPGPKAVVVRFEYPDRYKAQAMVMAVTQELAQSGANGSVEYLDYASLPASPVFPNRYVISVLGFALGLLIGAVSLWATKRRTPPSVVA